MQQEPCLLGHQDAAIPVALFDQMEEGVLGCDLSGHINYANGAAAALLGSAPPDLIGGWLWQVEPRTTATALQRNFQRLASTGQPEHFDLYFAGRGRWLAGSLYRVGSRVYCLCRDVTPERETGVRLRMLTDASRVFDEAGPGLSAAVSTIVRTVAQLIGEGCFLRFSATGELSFGTERATDDGIDGFRAHAGALAQHVVDSGRELFLPDSARLELSSGLPRAARRAQRAGMLPKSLLIVPVRLGSATVASLGVWRRHDDCYSDADRELLRDIADRAALAIGKAWLWEESHGAWELAEQERARLDLALQATETGIWDFDPEAGELRWDDRCRELFGVDTQPVSRPRSDDVFRWIVEEDRQRVHEGLAGALSAQEDGQYSVEFRVRGPRDDEPRWLAIYGRLLFSNGRVRRFLGTLHDITGRKRAEAARERLVEELTRSVRFSEMFVGVLSHDLRSPLSAINTTAGTLLRRTDDETVARDAQRILSSGERIGRMVDQLLDFTRIRLGQGLPLERRPMDLAELLGRALDELGAAEQGRLLSRVSGDCRGFWDWDRLWQLIANLAANALLHRDPGSAVQIELDGSDPGLVVLEIRNRGTIPPEVLPTIFEPMHGRRRRAGAQGLGLGLFISSQIVGAHGGRIEVRSDEMAGTLFRVMLPRHQPSG